MHLSLNDIMAWGRKDRDGNAFSSSAEQETACEIHIPNRILIMKPEDARAPHWWELLIPGWNVAVSLRYYSSADVRNSLEGIGIDYNNAGFTTKVFDFNDAAVHTPNHSELQWPTYGFAVGGHGFGGRIFVRWSQMITPTIMTMLPPGYKYGTVIVFGCFAGHDNWSQLGATAGDIQVSPDRPVSIGQMPLADPPQY